ncbi:D-malate degradation protein R [Variovorax sp. PBS-H4]|uniref:LysR substrate-binding domain-containing protein n=1 Tax=Variovorax sp. PBS-H4 TaxID=434008 RepID=UPI001317A61F|nr:LysR substrate-binding domain-containing protein [Variovorax sp. PBS-H4]VTU22623.1 D-malate degradation protein R [Variovorax sp. PBS-H4]
MDLDALRIFAKVAELASFTRAAEQLGHPKARVSTAVQQLEGQLGTRLLHRTTRRVRLTQDGELFLERAKELVADAEELQAMFQQAPTALRGRLRVDLPVGIARHIVIPRLPEFFAAHPQLALELSTTDRRVDPVHEGFDCVLRIGPLRDSGLVARPLGRLRLINCASPGYLRAHGIPRAPEDLTAHWLVHYSPTLGGQSPGWEYHDGERYRFQPMGGQITVNSSEAYEAACLAGLGLIQAPVLGLQARIDQGLLEEVMPQATAEPMAVTLLYPHRRNLSQRVQAMLDWLARTVEPMLC